MIHKADIERLVRQVIRRRRGVHDHQIIHPARDWFIGVGASLILVVGVGYWSALTYIMVSNRSVEVVTSPTTEVSVYRADLVQAALNKFRERATAYEALLTSRVVPVVPNPSAAAQPEDVPSVSASTTEPDAVEELVPAEIEEVPPTPEATIESL